MTMFEIFEETVKDLPVELNILSRKDGNTKCKIRLEHGGVETTVELRNSCEPGEEKDYCWSVVATAMSTIYFYRNDYKKVRLWLDAMHDRSLITAENA